MRVDLRVGLVLFGILSGILGEENKLVRVLPTDNPRGG